MIAHHPPDISMRSAIAVAVLMCMLVLVPATAEPNTMMQSGSKDPKQPNEGNTTMRVYSDGRNCWVHFNDNDTEGEGATEDEPYYEETLENGLLEIDLWCEMEPSLKPSLLLDAAAAFGGNILIELSGSWENGQEGCTGSNNNNCENLNISFYRGTSVFYREEMAGLSDGTNNIQINAPVVEEYLEFDGSSDTPQIRFEMVIVGNYQRTGPGGIFEEGEEALFRLYLGNNSTIDWPVDPSTWDEGFAFEEEDEVNKGKDDTPGFTTVLAMAAVAAGALLMRRRPDHQRD